jgi:hypothetical protein
MVGLYITDTYDNQATRCTQTHTRAGAFDQAITVEMINLLLAHLAV